jgi:hypothetical protein
MKRWRGRSIAGLAALALLTGCKSRPAASADDAVAVGPVSTPVPPPIAKEADLLKRPALDLSKGTAGFPLETTRPPASRTALLDALLAGYGRRLVDTSAVDLRADGPGDGLSLAALTIDISGSRVRPDYVPKELAAKNSEPTATLTAGVLRYTADPLHYQGSDASLRLTATRATLGMIPASDGTFGLSLVDCDRGQARVKLSVDGLRQSLAGAIKVHRSLAFSVEGVELTLSSDSPRSLSADVLVRARLLLVPATFRLTGRTDVDDAFNVHFSRLNAAGQDPAGAIVAGLVQGRLDKVNNKAARLLKLPGDKIRLDAFSITLDRDIVVDVGLRGSAGH